MARKTVMVADDDMVAVKVITAALHKIGIDVVVARDAMQAVMGAHRSQPDAILLDVNMPGGTGVMALQKIKSSSKTQQIPVLVVSGSEDPDLPTKVRVLGALDFIKKPLEPLALQKRISEVLGLPVPGEPAAAKPSA